MNGQVLQNGLRPRTRKVQSNGFRNHLEHAVLVMVLTGALPFAVLGAVVTSASAQEAPAGFLSGMVTAKPGKKLEIDNQNYSLHKKVMVKDDQGRVRNLQDLGPNAYVQFHLKHGKIDRIIWLMPR